MGSGEIRSPVKITVGASEARVGGVTRGTENKPTRRDCFM